jgi:hypothetical protein
MFGRMSVPIALVALAWVAFGQDSAAVVRTPEGKQLRSADPFVAKIPPYIKLIPLRLREHRDLHPTSLSALPPIRIVLCDLFPDNPVLVMQGTSIGLEHHASAQPAGDLAVQKDGRVE